MGGILRNHLHKRRATGGKRAPIRNKRKFELARPAAMTKLGAHRVHPVRCRGGMIKKRALRLDSGNNELVRTKTLVKNAIVVIDGTPFRQWYESHYATPLGRKKGAKLSEEETALMNKKRSNKTALKYKERQKTAAVEHALEDHFMTGRVLAAVSSRPGQSGRADGYILKGKELEFYLRKIKAKKGNK